MPLRDLVASPEWDTAMWMIGWALTPEAAALDLDLAMIVRRVMRPGIPVRDEVWERAWTATCRLVMLAQESNLHAKVMRPVEEEELVRAAAQLLGAEPALRVIRGG